MRSKAETALAHIGMRMSRACQLLCVQGEIIVKEDPVLVVNMTLPDSDRKSILLETFNNLGQKDRKKIESLYDSEPEGAEEYRILRIFQSNSIQGRCHMNFIFSK